MVKVSIIMPIYNSENHLENALNSIKNQTFEDFEVICVDDGSTDNSIEILKDFSNMDSRFKIITQENSGAGSARNNGLKQSNGEYIFFMDSDDCIIPDFLKLTYENITLNDSDILFFKIGNIINNKAVKRIPYFNFDEIFEDVDFNNFTFNYKSIKKHVLNSRFAPWTKLYKKEFLDRYDDFEFDEKLPFEDILFHIKVILRASKISFIPHYLYYYRLDNENSLSYDASLHEKIFNIVDIVKDFLTNENYFNEFKKEYEYFKVQQITRHIPPTVDEDYYRKAKDYLIDVDLDKNDLISKYDRNFHEIFFNSANCEIYHNNLRIYLLNEKYSKLKKETELLNNDDEKYKDLKNQKKQIKKEILSLQRRNLINSYKQKKTAMKEYFYK